MCPNCRAFVGAGDRECPYCGVRLGAPTKVERTDGLIGGVIPQAYFVTSLILLINGVLFVITVMETSQRGGGVMQIDSQTLDLFGAKDATLIFGAHQWWRLLTAGFLHGGLIHIAMNSWALFDVGSSVEELFGASRLIVIYFVATILGFLFSTYFSHSLSVGASAGILGLIGAMIAYGQQQRTSMGSALKRHYVVWAAMIFVIGLVGGFRVDNWAHFGGLAGGFAAAYIPGLSKQVWKGLAAACLVACAVAFFLMVRFMQAVQL